MKNTPWSISKANVAHQCQYRYHLQYSKKTKGHRVESSAGRIGTAVHGILERMLAGGDYRESFIAEAMAGLTRPETLDLKTFESGIHRFVAMFKSWRRKMGGPEVYLEHQLAFTEAGALSEYWGDDTYFRCVYDIYTLVERDGKLYALVFDHKTGDPSDIDKYSAQLNSYLATAILTNPEVAGAQAAIHWVKAEEKKDEKPVVWGKMYTREDVLTSVVPSLREYLQAAEALTQERPKPTEGWYCDFCQYQKICPLKIPT